MKTYKDVAQQALKEYAEGFFANNDYVSTPSTIAAAAWDAMIDGLVDAGADLTVIGSFLDTEVEEYVEDTWNAPVPNDNAAALRQAAEILLKVAESL